MENSELPPSQKVVAIPLELLDEPHYNPNTHPESQIWELSEDLRSFKQRKTIAVWKKPDGRYEVLAGNGIKKAAELARWTTLDCTLAPQEWDLPTRKAFALADNNRNSNPDLTKVAEILTETKNLGKISLEALGYNEQRYAELMEQITADFDKMPMPGPGPDPIPPDDFKEYGEDLQTEHECPKCGFKF